MRAPRIEAESARPGALAPGSPLGERSTFGARLAAGDFVTSVEVNPPGGLSLDKKIKAYKPDYSSEPDDEEPEATMTIRQGGIQKCKNGKKSLRPVKSNKKDWTADKSFDQWLREEEVDGAARKDAVEDCEDREQKTGTDCRTVDTARQRHGTSGWEVPRGLLAGCGSDGCLGRDSW